MGYGEEGFDFMAEDGTRAFLMALHDLFPWMAHFLSEEEHGHIQLFLVEGGGTSTDVELIAGCLDFMVSRIKDLHPEYLPPRAAAPRHVIEKSLGPAVCGMAVSADRLSKTAKYYAAYMAGDDE